MAINFLLCSPSPKPKRRYSPETYKRRLESSRKYKQLHREEIKKKALEYYHKHSDAIKLKKKQWKLKNTEKIKLYALNYASSQRLKVRNTLHEFFGGKCIICGNDDGDVLQFDHINNDGFLEQKKRRSIHYIQRQIKHTPDIAKTKYQLLCANCNRKKHNWFLEFNRLEKLGVPPF